MKRKKSKPDKRPLDINDFVGNTGNEYPLDAFLRRKKAVEDGSYHAAIEGEARINRRIKEELS